MSFGIACFMETSPFPCRMLRIWWVMQRIQFVHTSLVHSVACCLKGSNGLSTLQMLFLQLAILKDASWVKLNKFLLILRCNLCSFCCFFIFNSSEYLDTSILLLLNYIIFCFQRISVFFPPTVAQLESAIQKHKWVLMSLTYSLFSLHNFLTSVSGYASHGKLTERIPHPEYNTLLKNLKDLHLLPIRFGLVVHLLIPMC